MNRFRNLLVATLFIAAAAAAQDQPIADPGSLAFEEGRWEDVISEYRVILAAYPEDRVSWLRIAQAERELGRHDAALETLNRANVANAPEAMIDLERGRNYLALGRPVEAMGALESADHVGLRALTLLEDAPDLEPLRDERRFEVVYRNVRSRVYPCEGMPEADAFDFWLGRWEVRAPDGTLLGYDNVTKAEGGCAVVEQWEGGGGSRGASMTFYLPSREQWRHVYVGSTATMIDMTGGTVDGEMTLEGTVEYADQDRVVAIRARWSQSEDGRVRQRIEEFNLAGQNWELWFDGFFRRLDD
jgi:tetratricopeptide (TPR) repeat protein